MFTVISRSGTGSIMSQWYSEAIAGSEAECIKFGEDLLAEVMQQNFENYGVYSLGGIVNNSYLVDAEYRVIPVEDEEHYI
jgi:hypothetical protein